MAKTTTPGGIVTITDETTGALKRYDNVYGDTLATMQGIKRPRLVLTELGSAYGFVIKGGKLYESKDATYPMQ